MKIYKLLYLKKKITLISMANNKLKLTYPLHKKHHDDGLMYSNVEYMI